MRKHRMRTWIGIALILVICLAMAACAPAGGMIVEQSNQQEATGTSATPEPTVQVTPDKPGESTDPQQTQATPAPTDASTPQQTEETMPTKTELAAMITAFEKERVSSGDVPSVAIYRTAAFEDGVLAVAEFNYDGETAPGLYYVRGGEVESASVNSFGFSLNYTLFEGKTVLFDRSIPYYMNAPTDAQDWTDTFTMYVRFGDETAVAQGDEDGFILIKEGYERPLSYHIVNGNGKAFDEVEIPGTTQIARFENDEEIVLNYCPMATVLAYRSTCSIEIAGGTETLYLGQMHLKPAIALSFMWMDGWAFVPERFAPGTPFVVRGGQNVYDFFWVDLRGTTADSEIGDMVMETGRETPAEPGFYMLIMKADYGYYVKPFEIAE